MRVATHSAMKFTWERTVIAGKTGHEDFTARDETGREIGRVYRQIGSHHAGNWFWCMNAWGRTLIGRSIPRLALSRPSRWRPKECDGCLSSACGGS